ncbi:hypothetical protein QYM36_013969 [Artemia franciscana]|uniref:Dual specificity protein phosphatase 22 n=3 Tax=Artemia franciscana TaxID=6661 RepID=A0AA88HNQ5_ARTSF|nr:hypothetical protein QYM36_013969 [Artemia franciscana]
MSRSVAIAVAYVMSVTSLEWKEALNAVRGARAVANPNSGFQRQLQDFSGDRVAEERKRIQEKFGIKSMNNELSDEASLKKLVLLYQGLVRVGALCDGVCSRLDKCPTGVCRGRLLKSKIPRSAYPQISTPQLLIRERHFVEISKRRLLTAKTANIQNSVLTVMAPSKSTKLQLNNLKKHSSQPCTPVGTPGTPPKSPRTPTVENHDQNFIVGVFVKSTNCWNTAKLTRKFSKLFTGHDPSFSSLPDIPNSTSPARLNRLARSPSSDSLEGLAEVHLCPTAQQEVTQVSESSDGLDPLDIV